MVTTKMTSLHDRLALTVKDGAAKLNLGWSRYRDTCSGTLPEAEMRRALKAWGTIRMAKGGGTMGEKLSRVDAHLAQSENMAEAIWDLEQLAAKHTTQA